MRYNRTNNIESPRGGDAERESNRGRSQNRKGNSSDGSKRLILIASCIVLAVLCVLLLFRTCKVGEDGNIQGTEEQGKEQLRFAQFFVYKNVTQNAINSPSYYNFEYQKSNSITGSATDILNLIVLNANRVYGDGTWVVGNAPATSEILNFTNYNFTCYEALLALVEQWNLRWNLYVNQTTGKYVINIYPKNENVPQSINGLPSNPSVQTPEPFSPTPDSSNSPVFLVFSIIGLVILLASYITAKVKSKKGELVITANVFDKILILLSPILFFIVWFIGFDHELSEFQIVLLSLSGLMLSCSIVFSIIANKGNVFNMVISILAKLFIFVFTNFLLLLLLTILVIYIFLTIASHSSSGETYIVKYDHFLDQWVGYRVD